MDNQQAVRSQLLFNASRKSLGVAYILWFFLGQFGAHRFYLGKAGSGAAQLSMALIGWTLAIVAVGFLLLVPLWIWVLIDAVLIPGMAEKHNLQLADQLSAA